MITQRKTHQWTTIVLGLVIAVLWARTARANPAPAAKPVPQATGLNFETPEPGSDANNTTISVNGRYARRQLLVTGTLEDGRPVDLTNQVKYTATPENVVNVDSTGLVTPVANGQASIKAVGADGAEATTTVVVSQFDPNGCVSFTNQIVPVLSKYGCNSGACHGKASGQNGFKLSLLGFEADEDYEHLVKEGRGRRVFPAAPDESLMLLKPTGAKPHEGGSLIERGSYDYNVIRQWIAQGVAFQCDNEPTISGISVYPEQRTMRPGEMQQLVVIARYSDGSWVDATRTAMYESNDRNMADVSKRGLVSIKGGVGDAVIMIRYQAQVAVFRAMVPLGAPVAELPESVNVIDELVFKKLKTLGMPPSQTCDDATFLRRTSLDITGQIPTLEQAQAFLADTAADKRAVWIDKLLASTDYADYFANKWSGLLRNRRSNDTHAHGTVAFHSWIRDNLHANVPYDQFVRSILTATGDISRNPPTAWYREVRSANEQLEDSAQLFLGVRMQCARCHHHPFEKWTQKDYYGYAAFFSRLGRKGGPQPGEEIVFHNRGNASAQHPKTKEAVPPTGLGAEPASLGPDEDPRAALADWMSSPENPFFGRMLVNRYWKHFFGRGLVESEDDMRDTNPPTNPELLDAVAKLFVDSGFDMKGLIRAICNSRVYQLSSLPNEHNAQDTQNYSRYYPKRLPAELLLDAINRITNTNTAFPGLPGGTRAVQLPDNSFNAASYMLKVFGRPDMKSSCECERTQDASLAQSLHLINSKNIQDKLTADNGRAAMLCQANDRSDDEKIRELYLRMFSREPVAEEVATAKEHIAKKTNEAKDKPEVGQRQAYEDILWALLNTKEFLFIH